jgi:hypothetical protein
VAQTVKDVPSRFLGDAKVRGQGGTGNAPRVVRDHPNRGIPSPKRKLGVLKYGSDADAEPLPADIALVDIRARQRADAGAIGIAAQRTEFAIGPPDRGEMVDGGLPGRKGREHLGKGFEGLQHGAISYAPGYLSELG